MDEKYLGMSRSLLFSVLFLLAADIGAFSEADGLISGLVLLLVYADFLPHLLILFSVTQDAPGLAQQWSRMGLVFLCVIAILRYLPHISAREPWYQSLRLIIATAVAVVCLALINSYAQHYLGGHLQDMSGRNPMLLAMLMLINIFAALAVTDSMRADAGMVQTILLAIVHGTVIVLLQALLGSDTLHSVAAKLQIAQSYQLSSDSAFGLPRLTGAFLSPNAFGLVWVNMALLLVALRPQLLKIPITPWGFFGMAIFLMLFTQSKNAALMAGFAGLYLLVSMWRDNRVLVFGAITLLVGGIVAAINMERIISGLRLGQDLTNGYRYQAIMTALHNMRPEDWIFGMGLSHWPVMFTRYLPFSLADPHTWVLSIPGTFGLPGLLFYGLVAIWLFRQLRTGQHAQRFLAVMMAYGLLVAGLFDIPYLLGNTILTILTWLIMAQIASVAGPGQIFLKFHNDDT